MEYCPYCFAPVQEDGTCSSCAKVYREYLPGSHQLMPGTILAQRYRIGVVLGEGGFGITYLGYDLRLGVQVAVKEYFPLDKASRHTGQSLQVRPHMGSAAELFREGKAKFLEEARVLARLVGVKQIINVRDCFEDNNTAYIIMEYVDGITLTQWVEQQGGRISAQTLLPMMEGIFSALAQLHSLGLIHRDISPDNMMLEKGTLRLLDFGSARETALRTETLTMALRHGYAPVEQYQPMGQGPWTDVYALSATIYYCLTGVTPPHALERILEDKLVIPSHLGADLTHRQEQVLLYGLGVRPRRRFRSVEAMEKELYAP